jgi:hypothetical protein
VQVDRHDAAARDGGVLDREMAQPPTPKTATMSDERVPATLTALYVVTPAHVSGGRVEGVDAFGHFDDVAGVRGGVVPEASVDRVTRVLLLRQSVSQPETQWSQMPQA